MKKYFMLSCISALFYSILSLSFISISLVEGSVLPEKLWVEQFGSTSNEQAAGMTIDIFGNIYITGRTAGDLYGSSNAGINDIFLTKYSFAGERLWTVQTGCSKEESGSGLVVDKNGNIFMCGRTDGALHGNMQYGNRDMFLMKFDKFGNRLWTKQFGGPPTTAPGNIAIDQNDNLYISGLTDGSLEGNEWQGSLDAVLWKFDLSGNKIWTLQFGTPNEDMVHHGIAIDFQGDVYLCGHTYGTFDGNVNLGSADAFVAKIDPSANLLWVKQFGTSKGDNAISLGANGNFIYLTGHIDDYFDGRIDSHSFLAKFDLLGNEHFVSQFGSEAYSDVGFGVAFFNTDNIYVSGMTNGNRLQGCPCVCDGDAYLAKFDAQGNNIWLIEEGTNVYDQSQDISIDKTGNIVITGTTLGGMGDNSNLGGSDIYLIKYRDPTINQPPVANAGLDQNVSVGKIVILDGGESSDPDNDLPLSYEWAILDKPIGSQTVLSNVDQITADFVPDLEGIYVIQLIVIDINGAQSVPAFTNVTVEPAEEVIISLDTDSDDYINALTVYNGKLYAGTGYNSAIYSYDGMTWKLETNLDNAHWGHIHSFKEYNGKLYIGTNHYTSGTNRGRVWEFDGTDWTISHDWSLDNTIHNIFCLEEYQGKLYAGTGDNGKIRVFDGVTWEDAFLTNKTNVHCLQEYNGKLYAGVYEHPDGLIYEFDGTTWSLNSVSGETRITSFAVYQNKLYAGTSDDGVILVYDGDTWSESFNSDELYLASLCVFNDKLYAGGYDRGNIYVFDGCSWALEYSTDEIAVLSLMGYNNKLFAGTERDGKIYELSIDVEEPVQLLEEEFKAQQLDPAWEIVPFSGYGRYSLADNLGHLRYYLEGNRGYSGGWHNGYQVESWHPTTTLIREYYGDSWVLHAKGTYNLHNRVGSGSTGAQRAGLYIAFGDGNENYLYIDRGVDYWYNANYLNVYTTNINGTPEPFENHTENFKAPDDIDDNEWMRYTYFFKVVRNHENISVFISYDGINYSLIRSLVLPNSIGNNQKIIIDQCVWTTAGSYVDWDYFKVNKTSGIQQPTADAGPDQTISVGENCQGLVALDGTASSDPNNNPLTYTWTGPFGTISGPTPNVSLQIGIHNVTLDVNNGNCGNASDNVVITVVDDSPPVPDTEHLLAIIGTCDIEITTIPTATDNCSGAITGATDDPLSYNSQGNYTITWTYDDGNGNISDQSQQVIILDESAPIPVVTDLPTITGECSAEITIIPTATDNCTGALVGTTNDPLIYTSQGEFTVTWTFDDGNGNSTTQTQTVVVDDNTPPVLSCPADVILECSADTDPSAIGTATAKDNCGNVTVTYIDAIVSGCGNTKTITRTWTATDECGNSSSCEQLITVVDKTPPEITCPADVTLECPSDTDPSATGAATANDDCGSVTITYNDAVLSGCGNTKTITRTWTATDECGNSSSCDQIIKVIDTMSPVAPSLPLLSGECSVEITTAPTAMDDCAGEITGDAGQALPITIIGVGEYVVTWTFNDPCGNVTSADQPVTITDVTAPVPDQIALGTVTGQCSATIGTIPTASDNCVGTVTGTTTDPLTYMTQGEFIVKWTFDDGNGNVTTQRQTVIVNDVTAPVPDVVVLPDVIGQCSAKITTPPTAIDNCIGSITGTTTDPLTYTEQGTYTVTWTFDDGNGNVTTQTQTVIVKDVTNPVPDIQDLRDVTGQCSATINEPPTATDNCVGIIGGTTTDPLTYTEQGTHTVTWTYDDGNGNVSTQTQLVKIEDTTPPGILAELIPLGGDDDDEQLFKINYVVSDDCDPSPKIIAKMKVCNKSVKIKKGQKVEIEIDDDDCEIEWDDGILEIEAPNVKLIVKATDFAGNTNKVVVIPTFGPSDDDDDDDEEDDD